MYSSSSARLQIVFSHWRPICALDIGDTKKSWSLFKPCKHCLILKKKKKLKHRNLLSLQQMSQLVLFGTKWSSRNYILLICSEKRTREDNMFPVKCTDSQFMVCVSLWNVTLVLLNNLKRHLKFLFLHSFCPWIALFNHFQKHVSTYPRIVNLNLDMTTAVNLEAISTVAHSSPN